MLSRRAAIRKDIEDHTKAFRDAFLLEKKDYWLPLLPENNYIRKLAEKHQGLSSEEVSNSPVVSPYTEIETQPKGVSRINAGSTLQTVVFYIIADTWR